MTEDAQLIVVRQEMDANRARRAAMTLADRLGFDVTEKMEVATAVSELAHNLVWHAADGGAVTLRAVFRGQRRGLEVVCEDQGPGIPDIDRAVQNGFSTIGGLGGGLPGAKRLMDEFHIESEVGRGTTIIARKWA
ncbi:MAG: anti-sigma regulatory factor [Anaerolineae bacterium]